MKEFQPKNPNKSSSVALKALTTLNPFKLGITRKVVSLNDKKMPKIAGLVGAALRIAGKVGKKGLKESITNPGFVAPVAFNLATGKPGQAAKSGFKNFNITSGFTVGDIGENYKSNTIREKYKDRNIKIDYKKEKNQIPKEEE